MDTDLAVIGAGAAGLMTAIHAARSKPAASVAIFDSRGKIGAKILISGGTRCNVTNREVTPQDYYGGPSHFVRHVLEAYTSEETIRFFKEIGVELVLEPSGKYFPTTHSGRTVLNALVAAVERSGVSLLAGARLTGVKKDPRGFHLDILKESGQKETVLARRLVLATGGLSYTETG